MKTWFIPDLLSSLPFDQILDLFYLLKGFFKNGDFEYFHDSDAYTDTTNSYWL